MRVLAVWSPKGGVGKTTAAVHLAHLAATDGLRTLLWDLDPQGAASFILRVAPRLKRGAATVARRRAPLAKALRATDFDNLQLLPADFSLRHLDLELNARAKPRKRLALKLAPLAGAFDLALLDCPPSVSLVSEAVLRAADAVLVPVIPNELSLRTLAAVRRMTAKRGGRAPEVLPFLSMVDRRRRLHRDLTERLAGGTEGFLAATIPTASELERVVVARRPVTAGPPRRRGAVAYRALWAELCGRLGFACGKL